MNHPFILRVSRHIETNMDNTAFSSTDLAKLVFLSRTQLHRRLKAILGIPTSLFIQQLRLKKAVMLLQHTNNTITAIAFEVGFKDVSYFARVFKKQFGMTPSAFRKQD